MLTFLRAEKEEAKSREVNDLWINSAFIQLLLRIPKKREDLMSKKAIINSFTVILLPLTHIHLTLVRD